MKPSEYAKIMVAAGKWFTGRAIDNSARQTTVNGAVSYYSKFEYQLAAGGRHIVSEIMYRSKYA